MRMTSERLKRSAPQHILIAALFLGLTTVAAPHYSQASTDEDWWETDEEQTPAELREKRERERAALQSRLNSKYHTNEPYVSPKTNTGLSIAIKRYRSIVAEGGWSKTNYDKTLRINDTGTQIWALRQQLHKTGDLRETSRSWPKWEFDSSLRDAVARFQLRHGLNVTGFLDKQTRYALNVPAIQRLRQLELNLARLRELSKISTAQRYVLVNIPAYSLQAVQENSVALQSKVVVGQSSRATPSLSTSIRELNFHPYWRVPKSILARDLIPQIRKKPSYFYEQHYKALPAWGAKPLDPRQLDWSSPDIFNLKFRQDPGPLNALGVLRLNMPNKDIVYLHDTPMKKLFNRSRRAFSSGCVRVRKITELATWLLKEQSEWPGEIVKTTVALGQRKDIKLETPVPVHFVYVTAWARDDGTAFFREDIYGRDQITARVTEVRDETDPDISAISP